MAVSVFLGGFGFGNLGDEACLATALKLYATETNCVFSRDDAITRKVASFDLFFNDIEQVFPVYPRIDQVILAGGGIGFMPSLRDNIDWALRCKRRGAKVFIHNIGIGKVGGGWLREWPYLLPVMTEAAEFSVRDFHSRAEVVSWGVGLKPEVSFYPERNHPLSSTFQPDLPPNLLGISMNNRGALWNRIEANHDEIRQILSGFPDSPVLPIVSTIHVSDAEEHDQVGFQRFVEMFGLHNRVVGREFADPTYWREHLGPAEIKTLVSRCSFLISARKHNIVHAIGCGVPFLGMFEAENDSIPRVYQTLFPHLAKGSSLYPLYSH